MLKLKPVTRKPEKQAKSYKLFRNWQHHIPLKVGERLRLK